MAAVFWVWALFLPGGLWRNPELHVHTSLTLGQQDVSKAVNFGNPCELSQHLVCLTSIQPLSWPGLGESIFLLAQGLLNWVPRGLGFSRGAFSSSMEMPGAM